MFGRFRGEWDDVEQGEDLSWKRAGGNPMSTAGSSVHLHQFL
jgi:hypothetical protein